MFQRSKHTLIAYQSDWKHFAAWCAGLGLACLPASSETLALYVAHLVGSGFRVTTCAVSD